MNIIQYKTTLRSSSSSSRGTGDEYRLIFYSVLLRGFELFIDVLLVSLQVYEPLMLRYTALEDQLLKDHQKSLHLL